MEKYFSNVGFLKRAIDALVSSLVALSLLLVVALVIFLTTRHVSRALLGLGAHVGGNV